MQRTDEQWIEYSKSKAPSDLSVQERLRIRSAIRRSIASRKSVQRGERDRLCDLLDEAAQKIEQLEQRVRDLEEKSQ